MQTPEVRIAIAHSNQLFRESLSCYLSQHDPFCVVHMAPRLGETGKDLAVQNLDVLIVEFALLCPLEEHKILRTGSLPLGVKVLVIDVPEREEDILYCIEAGGASGYLVQNASLKDLEVNLAAIARGETVCSPRIAHLAFCRMSWFARLEANNGLTNGVSLTRREVEIVRLIEAGLSNKEIATRLNIGVSTVKNHVHNILDKLQLPNRYSVVKHGKERIAFAGSV
ncbi:MAG: response regulator transcription factor [Nitrospira sp.]|nr:response regulator transcription factor [Nitrospira sp.]